MRAELDANPALKHDTAGMSDAAVLMAIGAPEAPQGSGEGLFFPDTYLFDKDTSDIDIYRRAYRLMQTRIGEAWLTRAPGLPYRTPYDALTMASIVEKETARRATGRWSRRCSRTGCGWACRCRPIGRDLRHG